MARIRGLHAEIIMRQVKDALESNMYRFFDGGKPYDVNIVGVRRENGTPNKFDDMLMVVYRDRSKRWCVNSYVITTDPGLYWLKNPSRVAGTAILVPGQYRSVYKIDKHGGKYEALCQRLGRVSVYRDGDKDSKHDMDEDTVQEGSFGINIHKAGNMSSAVNKWSAGCQVFKNASDFEEFMDVIRHARDIWGNSFTYTLLREQDIMEVK
tara:strand:- start:359 stop:985 length:627 start_codon:yes stop_codon:yes gene_type:complete